MRYEDLFSIQPFNNNLVTMTLSGAQVVQLLEQQWSVRSEGARLLTVSRGFSYGWDASQPVGQRVLPGSVLLNGRALQAGDSVRVTVNSFLAGGGDSFPVLKEGSNLVTGIMDVDALELYVKANPTLAPGPLDRVIRTN